MKQIHCTQARRVHGLEDRSPGRNLYIVPERRIQRAVFAPVGRSLHLIDIENLLGSPHAGDVAVWRTLAEYRAAASVIDGDHVIIGANPRLGLATKACWPSARLVVRGGRDGADIALLESVRDIPFIAARYDRIVIGSGDGVFEVVVREYRRCGLAVAVVARKRSLSYLLGESATLVGLLPNADLMEVTL